MSSISGGGASKAVSGALANLDSGKEELRAPDPLADGPPVRYGLFIDVVEGRSVAAKDSTGLSDPFLTIALKHGDEEAGTKKAPWTSVICDQTLNPKWRQLCDFVDWVPPRAQVVITGWDKDLIGSDDFLGHVEFRAGDYAEGGPLADDYTAADPNAEEQLGADVAFPFTQCAGHEGEHVSGTLHLRISYRPVGAVGEECEQREQRLLAMVNGERDNIDTQESTIKFLPKGPGQDAAKLELKEAKERLKRLEAARASQNKQFLKAVSREADWQKLLDDASAEFAKVHANEKYIESYAATGVSVDHLKAEHDADRVRFEEALAKLNAMELEFGLAESTTSSSQPSKSKLLMKKLSSKGGLFT